MNNLAMLQIRPGHKGDTAMGIDGLIPNFEVLLTSNDVDGYAPQSRIVAYRAQD